MIRAFEFALLAALLLVGACVALSPRPNDSFVEIRNENFYPAHVQGFCNGFKVGPAIRVYERPERRALDLSRCASVGAEVTLLATGETWAFDGVTLTPGSVLVIVLTPQLAFSYFTIR